MKTLPATRSPATDRTRLSDALAASSGAAARLRDFARSTGCDPLDLSIDAGKSLDLGSVLDMMRQRGYQVSDPVRPQAQPRRGATAWPITIGVHHVKVTLVFYVANPQP